MKSTFYRNPNYLAALEREIWGIKHVAVVPFMLFLHLVFLYGYLKLGNFERAPQGAGCWWLLERKIQNK